MSDSEPTFGDGRYIVRRELGRGTMGVVFEAEDPVLARTVAIKTIDLAFAPGQKVRADFERRFFSEARVAAQLSHPGIVVCHDVGKDPLSGQLFIVFEHLKGRTLEDRAAQGPMAWREALEVVIQVARAIHHAHEHGVVHRDLKPANIMLLDRGGGGAGPAAKIMDFGVARLESLGPRITKTGQAFGSPLYMSPEQALGQPSTARSDIFSLGSVLCTLLLGRPWFEAPSLPKIVDRVVNDDPPRPSRLRPETPAALDAVVAKALAKREADRYASASDMADDLEDVLAGRTARHAVAAASRGGRASEEDGLLAGLTGPARAPRASTTHDPLASLLDEAPVPQAAPRPGAVAAAPSATVPIGAVETTVTTRAARRWWMPASVLLGLAVLAGAFVSARRSSVPEPAPPPSVPVAASQANPAPSTTLPIEPTVAAVPEATPEIAAVVTPEAPVVRPAAPPVRPTAHAARPTVPATPAAAPVAEPSPIEVAAAAEEPSPEPSSAPGGSRIRLSVSHPFENGRLIVWVDGVLVHEAKLQAPQSRRIVAFKVRDGRAQTMLDVVPGPHEVRVEVTWDQGRTTRTKVVDVAEGATGLLEAKVGRMSKDLSLTWSRLAKD